MTDPGSRFRYQLHQLMQSQMQRMRKQIERTEHISCRTYLLRHDSTGRCISNTEAF